MANTKSLIEIGFKLVDLFSGEVKTVTNSYEKLSKSAKDNAADVEKANNSISRSFDKVKTSIASAATSFATSLSPTEAVNSALELAEELDKLNKTALKLGITVEELQELEYVAARQGIAFETAVKGIGTFNKRLGDLEAAGTGPAAKGLETLGLTIEDFANKSISDQLVILATAFGELKSQTEISSAAAALFSKGNGLELVKLFKDGSDNLINLNSQAELFAKTTTKEMADGASTLQDQLLNADKTLELFNNKITIGAAKLVSWGLGVAGISLDPVGDINKELEDQYEILTQLTEGGWIPFREARIEATKANIKALEDERKEYESAGLAQAKLSESIKEEIKNRKGNADAAEETSEAISNAVGVLAEAEEEAAENRINAVDSVIKSLEGQTTDAKRYLDQQTKELEEARAAQADIENKFEDLIENVFYDPSEVDFGTVKSQLREVDDELLKLDFERAEEELEKAVTKLADLQSSGELGYWAMRELREEVEAAAQAIGETRVEKELIDVAEAQRSLDELEARLAAASALKLSLDPSAAGTVGLQTARVVELAVREGVTAGLSGVGLGSAGGDIAQSIADELSRRGCQA